MGNYVPMLERGVAEGLAKGLAEGMEKGLQMKEKNVVAKMLKMKLDLNIITACTGVSKHRVLKIKKEAGL